MSKIGVLITSHPGHKIFIKETLKHYAEIAKLHPVVWGWDSTPDTFRHELPDNIELMPLGRRYGLQEGERLQLLKGAEKLKEKGCDYMLKTAGDYIIRKPDSLSLLIEYMGDDDFLSMHAQPREYALGTAIFFCKTEALIKIINYVAEGGTVSIPIKSGQVVPKTIECQLGVSLKENGYNRATQLRPWWGEIIGLRDLQREWIMKTGKKMGAAWEEGQKEYDLTEEQLNQL